MLPGSFVSSSNARETQSGRHRPGFRNSDFQPRMLLLHLANELNKHRAHRPHFRIVLPIGRSMYLRAARRALCWLTASLVNSLRAFCCPPVRCAPHRTSSIVIELLRLNQPRSRQVFSFRTGNDWGCQAKHVLYNADKTSGGKRFMQVRTKQARRADGPREFDEQKRSGICRPALDDRPIGASRTACPFAGLNRPSLARRLDKNAILRALRHSRPMMEQG